MSDSLEDYAKQVANHLTGWTFDEMTSSTTARLAGEGEQGLFLRSSTYDFHPERSRIEVTGRYPNHQDYGLARVYTKITAAAGRGPEAVAKDIKRRFLPRYLPVYREALESKRRYEEIDREQERILTKLAGILGGRRGRNRIYPNYSGYGFIEVQGTSVDFNLRSVSEELAVELAEVLARHPEGGESHEEN